MGFSGVPRAVGTSNASILEKTTQQIKNKIMLELIKRLRQVNLLSAKGVYQLLRSIQSSGMNLMALLQFSASMYPKRIAMHANGRAITYQKLFETASALAIRLNVQHGVKAQKKVALVCRNHTWTTLYLFAASRLGADVYLLNVEMSGSQLESLVKSHRFALVIHDLEVADKLKALVKAKKRISVDPETLPTRKQLLKGIPKKTKKLPI